MTQLEKIMSIYYGTDKLPYKDEDRQIHYPIAGETNTFVGENNTTKVRFFVDRIGGSNYTWVAKVKKPNGTICYRVLEMDNDDYVDVDLSFLYTDQVGQIDLALNGYTAQDITITEDDGVYEISGNPVVICTGIVKIIINYSPLILNMGASVQPSEYQQILALLSTKLSYGVESEKVNELPTTGKANTIYYLKSNDSDIVYDIYYWNGTTFAYLGTTAYDLYTKDDGTTFENYLKGYVSTQLGILENEISQIVDGSPKGVYATLSDLESAYPTGAEGIYVVSANGNWYYWNGTAWASGGTYLAQPYQAGKGISIEANGTIKANEDELTYMLLQYPSTNLFNIQNVVDKKGINFIPNAYPSCLFDYDTAILSGLIEVEENKDYAIIALNNLYIGAFAFFDSSKNPVCGCNAFGGTLGSWNSISTKVEFNSQTAQETHIKILSGSNIKYILFYLTASNSSNYYGSHDEEDLVDISKSYQVNEGLYQLPYQENPRYINEQVKQNSDDIETLKSKKCSVVLIKENNTLYIRSSLNDTKDIIHKVSLNGSNNGAFTYSDLYTINKNIPKGTLIKSGTVFKYVGDDIAPINYNQVGYLGANHGNYNFTEVTFSSVHDLQETDIGKTLTDANSNEFILITILSLTKIIVGKKGNGIVDNTQPVTYLKIYNVEHGISSQTTIQLYPSINNINVKVYDEDDNEITNDGIYFGNTFKVIEKYSIINGYDMIDYLIANVGDNTNDSYYSDNINSFMSVISNTYIFEQKGTVVEVRTCENKVSRWQFHTAIQSEKVGTYFAVPFTTYKNITNQSGTVNIEPSSYEDNTYVPTVFYQFESNNTNKGVCVGYCEVFGSARNETRLTDTSMCVQYYTGTNKIYPRLSQKTPSVDDLISSISFRTFFEKSNTNEPVVTTYKIKDKTFVNIYGNGNFIGNVKLSKDLIGKEINVVKIEGNIDIPTNFVSGEGIYTRITSYGFAILELK